MRLFGRRDHAPVATYAAVLDGVHLWLDLPGPVSVRDTDSQAVAELGEQPCDLDGLTGRSYEVLVGNTPVTVAADLDRPTARTPVAPDGVTQWEVGRGDDGLLRLTRRSVAATAELDAIDVRGDRVHLRIRPPGEVEPGCHLLLLDTDDQVLETLPVTAHDGLLEALVGVDDLPAGWFGMLRPAVGTDRSWVRIRRRDNDLADPNHAVLLPELYAVDADTELAPDRPRARFRWNPDGLLALRSIDPDEAGQPGGGATG
jgi:hypothetical protein